MEEGQQQQQQQQQRDRRPEALGDLRVLPDELLCVILGHLSPRDLGRLACVSSVMYILCNEESLWMNLCLRVGGPLEYKNSWKKTTLYRQNLSTEVSESNDKALRFEGFYSLFLYRRWYRCFTTLDTFIMDKGDLERKGDMSLEEFSTNYDGQKPVLLTDLANTWRARNTWTIDQLVQKYGETAFRISQRSSKKITMKFKDYVSYMSQQHDEDPLYIFDDKFAEAAPSLLNDYTVPVLFQEDYFDVLDVEQRPPFRWLIVGPERSGASWHVDPALTSAWNTLLLGRKRWALYPPGRVPGGVTVHVNEEDGDVDVESPSSLQWWLDIYPFLADEDKPLECTQLPGETIFVPSGWWHCVLNLETTIAVTQNFVNACNLQFVCLDMSPGHLHKGVSRAGWLAVQDKVVKLVKADSDIEQLDYVDTTRKEKRLKLLKPVEEQSRYNTSQNDNKSNIYTDFHDGNFSYDIEFLSKLLKEERDHYNSAWSAGNCIGQREFRQWLHKLWALKPEIRPLVWKGACLALNVDRWLACVMEICGSHDLQSPHDNERLPVGTGSNPVFMVSDYVIKIYVEGGLESSLYSLGTELEFYSLLRKLKSPLVKHVPVIFASGIVVHEGGFYRSCTWNGKGVPDLLTNFNLVDGNLLDDGFLFGVWGKMKFELRKEAAVSHSRVWPYLITKRCEGDIFANLRDRLSSDDILNLASFLGEQLRNLHLLPLPSQQIASHLESGEIHFTRRVSNGLGNHSDVFQRHFVKNEVSVSNKFSPEWKPFVAAIERRKIDLSSRLLQWGDPIPGVLVHKVEEYIPHDPALLLNVFKGEDSLYEAGQLPSWVHSDIMDDNIHMEQCCASCCFSPTITCAGSISVDSRTRDNMEESPKKWCPTHILDFGDLLLGDPICDLIPIHLDVFRGDSKLLKRFLESYNLPLGKKSSDDTLRGGAKFERTSYRAMCYCILHEENVLGAIFSLGKDLRGATSWEEVEEAVWGELNNYQCTD